MQLWVFLVWTALGPVPQSFPRLRSLPILPQTFIILRETPSFPFVSLTLACLLALTQPTPTPSSLECSGSLWSFFPAPHLSLTFLCLFERFSVNSFNVILFLSLCPCEPLQTFFHSLYVLLDFSNFQPFPLRWGHNRHSLGADSIFCPQISLT